jgi:hypothetical protein
MTQEPLSVEQLVEVKVSPLVKPKPPSATSIPAILKSLQVNQLVGPPFFPALSHTYLNYMEARKH